MISLPPESSDVLASLGLLVDMFLGNNFVELVVCFGGYVLISSAAYYQWIYFGLTGYVPGHSLQ